MFFSLYRASVFTEIRKYVPYSVRVVEFVMRRTTQELRRTTVVFVRY